MAKPKTEMTKSAAHDEMEEERENLCQRNMGEQNAFMPRFREPLALEAKHSIPLSQAL